MENKFTLYLYGLRYVKGDTQDSRISSIVNTWQISFFFDHHIDYGRKAAIQSHFTKKPQYNK